MSTERGNSSSSGKSVAEHYLERGWHPVFIEYKEKKPRGDDWQNRTITPNNVGKIFNGVKHNVGVQLGPKSGGLTDVDLDCLEAVELAPAFLPSTSAIFGRESKPASHYLYTVEDPVPKAKIAFTDADKTIIVELRLGGGGKAAQTVFPGSVHESGEAISWVKDGEPAPASCADLEAACNRLAAAVVLVRAWPEKNRHEAALCVGGYLARASWSADAINFFLEHVQTVAGVTDRSHIKNGCTAAADCVKALEKGEHVYGFPAVKKFFGDQAADTLAKFIGFGGSSAGEARQKLEDMNDKFCILPIGGKTRVVTFQADPEFPGHIGIGWASGIGDFRALHNKYRITIPTSDGKSKRVCVGDWWVHHEERRQYDKGMKFMPTRDERVFDSTLNLWTGFRVQARKPEGKSGAAGCKLFLEHALKIICSDNDAHYEYLMNREAFAAQRRVRSEIAVAMRSKAEGAGKARLDAHIEFPVRATRNAGYKTGACAR